MKKHSIVIILFVSALGASFWLGGYINSQNTEIRTSDVNYFFSHELSNETLNRAANKVKSATHSVPSQSAKTILNTSKNRYIEHAKVVDSHTETSKSLPEPSPYDVLPISEPIKEKQTVITDPMVQGDEDIFSSQSVDAEWAFKTEHAMWSTFDDANIETSTMESLECRETLCKVEVAHDDASAQAVFLEKLVAHLGTYRGTVLQYKDESGRPMTRFYSYR